VAYDNARAGFVQFGVVSLGPLNLACGGFTLFNFVPSSVDWIRKTTGLQEDGTIDTTMPKDGQAEQKITVYFTDCNFQANDTLKYRFYNVGANRIMEMAISFRAMPDGSYQIAKSGYGYAMVVTINKSNGNAELKPPDANEDQEFLVSSSNSVVDKI
jgi:hypothetical protein